MKLFYITSYTFPSKHAEPYYLKCMGEAFTKLMGDSFTLVIRGKADPMLARVRTSSVMMPKRFRRVAYFFWFPYFVFKNSLSQSGVVIMSHDPYLLLIVICWKKILRFQYAICSDWHQLFDDWKDVLIARNSSYLIATCKRLQSKIIEACGVPSGKVLVAYGGIDPGSFDEKRNLETTTLRANLGLPEGKTLVGYVGGFRSVGLEKGLRTMIKALPYLDDNYVMVFVGGTLEYIREYEEFAESIGVSERCIFVPKQPFEKVIEYELALDILAIPYPDQHHFRDYGFPMKVWEYMASGRPIIYSDLAIIGEILAGRGVSFVPDDEWSFAAGVRGIISDSKHSAAVARQNVTDVRSYTWDNRVAHILKFFDHEARI